MLRLPLRHHPIAKFLFYLLLVVSAILMLIPAKEVPNTLTFWDKLQHAICFAALTFTGLYAYFSRAKAVFIGLSLYGALIEVMQSTLTTTRQGDPLDWLADNMGILLIVALFYLLRRKCPNLA